MFTNNFSYFIIPLFIGFLLDLLLGDPLWLPHPIRLFGNMIYKGEKLFNSGNSRKIKGVIFVLLLTIFVWVILFLIQKLIYEYSIASIVFLSVMVFFGLANHNLIAEVLKVEKKLSTEGLDAGRKQLSFIVGRETSQLSENKIRIASLETLSENLSDGVVAPLFYYAIGGIPLMFTYKMINTLDSIIGYKSLKYIDFGWFAAKTDDVANYIPARITAFLMVVVTFSLRGAKFVLKYGNKHASPNSGYPESALAGILNCRFGGPNIYHGQLVEKPYIGLTDRKITHQDILKSCVINLAVSVLAVCCCFVLFELIIQ